MLFQENTGAGYCIFGPAIFKQFQLVVDTLNPSLLKSAALSRSDFRQKVWMAIKHLEQSADSLIRTLPA